MTTLRDALRDECGVMKPENLFTFEYPLPCEYKNRFENLFLKRYQFYHINYDSFEMFKLMLESKIFELLPKYIKLYASENMIFNPFVNNVLQNDSFRRERARDKKYTKDNMRGFETNEESTGGVDVSRTGNSGGLKGASILTQQGNKKLKSSNDEQGYKISRYTDAPQNQTEGVPDGIEGYKLFNDGFITEMNRDNTKNTNILSNNEDNFNRNSEQATQENYSNSQTYSDTVRELDSIKKVGSYNDSYDVSSLQNTIKILNQEYGLRNVTVSQVLTEWRTTFIKIDTMFLDELRSLFLYIYD